MGRGFLPLPWKSQGRGACKLAVGPSTCRGPLVIQVETVDSKGKPLSGVDLVLSVSYALGPGKNKSKIERATTSQQGRGRLEVALNPPGERAIYGMLWAVQPGRALATVGIPMLHAAPAPVRLMLEEPVKRSITVVGPDDRPIEGLSLTPRSLQQTGGIISIPEEWNERLTVATDTNGVATIPYLSRPTGPLTVRLSGPGVALHTLAIPAEPGKDPLDLLLKLDRPGRLVGVVRTESGQPLAGVPVEVWIRAAGVRPRGVLRAARTRRRLTPTEVIRFDAGSPRTGPEGAFQSPPALLGGSVYRVSIRCDGFAPYVSDWLTLDGDRTSVPPIRLRSFASLRARFGIARGGRSPRREYSCPRARRRTPTRRGDSLSGSTRKNVLLVHRQRLSVPGMAGRPGDSRPMGCH